MKKKICIFLCIASIVAFVSVFEVKDINNDTYVFNSETDLLSFFDFRVM